MSIFSIDTIYMCVHHMCSVVLVWCPTSCVLLPCHQRSRVINPVSSTPSARCVESFLRIMLRVYTQPPFSVPASFPFSLPLTHPLPHSIAHLLSSKVSLLHSSLPPSLPLNLPLLLPPPPPSRLAQVTP